MARIPASAGMGSKKKNRTEDGEYALVYSTDPPPEKRCKQCLRPESACVCEKNTNILSTALRPAIRMERKGRGGKTVTIAAKLPPHETFLKKLLTHLKSSIGSGGTFYIKDNEGTIEIQGDHRDKVLALILAYSKQ